MEKEIQSAAIGMTRAGKKRSITGRRACSPGVFDIGSQAVVLQHNAL